MGKPRPQEINRGHRGRVEFVARGLAGARLGGHGFDRIELLAAHQRIDVADHHLPYFFFQPGDGCRKKLPRHHLSQLLERAVVIGQVERGPVTLEGALFNGDEPEHPSQWPLLRLPDGQWRFGDSRAVRLTVLDNGPGFADKVLKRAPMFQLDQLKPIARFSADPTVLVVHADSPWKTYAEFIAYVKSNPAKVSFGSSGNYGTMHVPMEQLKAATSSHMLHVPYTGAGPAVMALLSGQIEALATGPASVTQQIKAGKLRALAHWGEGRLAALPDIPSLKELGVSITYAQWSGLFVPANTPAAVVDKLRQAAKFAATDARANQAMVAAGTSFMFQDMPEFERYVQTDAKDMAGLVQRIGKVD